MNVKEAAKAAIAYIADLFADERISDLGLEEVEFDEANQEWVITVGFSRPWDYPAQRTGLSVLSPPSDPHRVYKVLRIATGGDVLSVKNRKT